MPPENCYCGRPYVITTEVIWGQPTTTEPRYELLDNGDPEFLDNGLNEYLDNA